MPIITLDGHVGAGASELGRRISRMFQFSYVDKLVLPAYKEEKEAENAPRPGLRGFMERLWSLFERASTQFAAVDALGDPLMSGAGGVLLPLTWDISENGPQVGILEKDNYDMETAFAKGKTVVVERAGAVEFRDYSKVLRVGVFANWRDRVERVMATHGLIKSDEAERLIQSQMYTQRRYFSMLGADPDDYSLYDVVVNTSHTTIEMASIHIAREVRAMA